MKIWLPLLLPVCVAAALDDGRIGARNCQPEDFPTVATHAHTTTTPKLTSAMTSNSKTNYNILNYGDHKLQTSFIHTSTAATPTLSTPTSATHTHAKRSSSSSKCHFKCDEGVEKKANKNDCNIYYTCPYELPKWCPATYPYFDGEDCTDDQSKCCHNTIPDTTPKTTPGGTTADVTAGGTTAYVTPGGTTADVTPSGTTADVTPSDTTADVTPDGTTADVTPGGTTQGGTTPGGTTQDGTTPDGTTADSTKPDITTPGNTTPDGTTPVGTTSDGTTPGNTTPPPSGCLPPPDCSGLPPATMVADPADCHKYFVCLADGSLSDSSYPCPPDTYFHPVDQACRSIEDGPYLCWPSCVGQCPVSCDFSQRVFDPNNCTNYYYCYEGAAYLMQCQGADKYFNGHQCTNNATQCCSFPCDQPQYCGSVGQLLPHPTNCFAYYNCTEVGQLPQDAEEVNCPNNEVFDNRLSNCYSTAACDILC